MGPVAGLEDQRDGRLAAAAEEDRVDRHAARVVVLVGEDVALLDRRAVAAVRVAGELARSSGVQGSPFQRGGVGRRVLQALPPDVAVLGERDVGEDRVALVDGLASRCGLVCSLVPGATPKKPYSGLTAHRRPSSPMRIQAMSSPIASTFQPGMVGLEHGEVGLAAGARERRRDVLGRRPAGLVSLRISMCSASQPSSRAITWRCAARSTSCRAARCRRSPEPKDQIIRSSGNWTMYLVSLHGQATSSWPGSSGMPTECRAGTHCTSPAASSSSMRRSTWVPMRAITRIEAVTYAESVISMPNIGLLGLEVAHHERDDVHRAALHAARVELAHDGLHLVRVHPVVGGPAVLLVDRADVGAVLDARDVGRVGGRVEGVRLLRRVEPGEGAGGDQGVGELGPLLVGAGAPVDGVRAGSARRPR